MSERSVTSTSTSRRPGLVQSRRVPVKTPSLAQPSQRHVLSHGLRAGGLPMLSPQARPVQTPVNKPNTGPGLASSSPSRPRAKITEMIFCSSIQDRPEWAPAVALLQAARAEPRWARTRLSSHDLAIRIVPLDNTAASDSDNVIRFVLVAPADVGTPDTTQKLQRLAQRKNSLGGVVLFLLANGDGEGHNMAAYNKIQLDLRDTHLSVLPVTAVATLPATVAAFCSPFTMPPPTDNDSSYDCTRDDLLRMFFGNPVPLSSDGARRLVAATEEAAHRRPDHGPHHQSLGNIPLHDVVRFCTELEARGPHRIADLLGAEDAARLADF